jgi:pimeloyl-ACP methyl ester carboxylesterase
MERTLRQAKGDRGPMPPEFVDMVWKHWDKGTANAVLSLYRQADPDRLAAAGKDLPKLICPSLILWGARDPYLPPSFAESYARTLPSSTLQVVPAAGHWPWIDDPKLIDMVTEFVS